MKKMYRNVKVQVLKPAEEAAQRLQGTYDPSVINITADLKLAKPVEFITLDFIIDKLKPKPKRKKPR